MKTPSAQGRARAGVFAAGIGLLLGCLWAGRSAPQQGLLSYLFAFLFFTGLSAGSLALLLVHVLTGGAWGLALRGALLAAARLLPLQAALAVPLLLGVRALYPWSAPNLLAHDALLRAQSWYLEDAFFVARATGCFVLWLLVLALYIRWRARAARVAALARLAAVGLIVYALSTLLAATDWVMSLTPHWHSSIFGMLVATGWMLGAASLAVLHAAAGAARGAAAPAAPLLRDLGNLLLVLVLAWTYLALMQYLTIWIADQPAEISWYIPRTLTSWRALAAFLIVFHFAVPFALLLSRQVKERPRALAAIAAMLLIAQLADALWLVVPSLRAQGLALRWSDLLAAGGIGALWCALYLGQLQRARPDHDASGAFAVRMGDVSA